MIKAVNILITNDIELNPLLLSTELSENKI